MLELVQNSKVLYTILSHLWSLLESDDQLKIIDKFQILIYSLIDKQILNVCVNLRTCECHNCLHLLYTLNIRKKVFKFFSALFGK